MRIYRDQKNHRIIISGVNQCYVPKRHDIITTFDELAKSYEPGLSKKLTSLILRNSKGLWEIDYVGRVDNIIEYFREDFSSIGPDEMDVQSILRDLREKIECTLSIRPVFSSEVREYYSIMKEYAVYKAVQDYDTNC